MCMTCGCSDGANVRLSTVDRDAFVETLNGQTRQVTFQPVPDHNKAPQPSVQGSPAQPSSPDHADIHARHHGTTIALEEHVLAKNAALAERNRRGFQDHNILALNLVSSPGSGKTSLLERTIRDLQSELNISVIEGDQETVNDAERIRQTGCPVVQINTGTGCHLEADMVARSVEQLNPPDNALLMIENVGNLVCPALFDLGENAKVAIISVTEGEDKPVKYPHMLRASDILIINKIDLLPYLDFDVAKCVAHAYSVNPHVKIFEVSAKTGEGLSDWYGWLRNQVL